MNISSDNGEVVELNRTIQTIYDELRIVARRFLKGETGNAGFRTTELVHEAFLRVSSQQKQTFNDESHLVAVTAQMMRRVLVDEARARKTTKRGGDWIQVELVETPGASGGDVVDVLTLEKALLQLEEHDKVAASIVEMRCFAQLTDAEIAEVIGASERWVNKQWKFSLAWLRKSLISV
ncbi:MAG: RNA polymerase sigma-70 factor (ECF subfamily) [Candidatus Krumholzibacteriia bacterium]|jgi:RNA polymerase sigma-70 factor (ECF subfamily)